MRAHSFSEHRARILVAACAAVGVTAALTVTAPAASAYGTYPTPAITVAAGNTVIATQTSGDGLRFYWNQYGTNTWRGEQVAANGTTYSAPSMVQDGNGVNIVAEGPNHSLYFYWATNGTSTWHQETVAGANTTYSAPALANIGNAVGIVAEGPGNSLDYYWATNDTSTWTPETVAGTGTTYSAPSISPDGNYANVAADGPKDSLDFYWQQDGTTPWNPETVAGPWSAYSAPTITDQDSTADIAVEGPDNTFYLYWQINGTKPWYPSVPQVPEGSVAYGVPSITAYSDGGGDGVDVVTSSYFGRPYSYINYNGNGTWYLNDSDQVGLDSDVSVTENNYSQNLAYFGYYDGSEGTLLFAWSDSSGQFHQELVAAAGVN